MIYLVDITRVSVSKQLFSALKNKYIDFGLSSSIKFITYTSVNVIMYIIM